MVTIIAVAATHPSNTTTITKIAMGVHRVPIVTALIPMEVVVLPRLVEIIATGATNIEKMCLKCSLNQSIVSFFAMSVVFGA